MEVVVICLIMGIIALWIAIVSYCEDFAIIYRAERLSGRSRWKAFQLTFTGETHFRLFVVDSGTYYDERNAGRLKSTDIYMERNSKREYVYRLPDGREIPVYKQKN